jgi:hypothetical protein
VQNLSQAPERRITSDKFPLSISRNITQVPSIMTHFLQQSASVVPLSLLSVYKNLSKTPKKVSKKNKNKITSVLKKEYFNCRPACQA